MTMITKHTQGVRHEEASCIIRRAGSDILPLVP